MHSDTYYILGGIKLANYYEVAEQNGINESTLYNRMFVLGWSLERAATTPVRKKGVSKAYKAWSKWKDVATENNISYQAYINRVNRGWEAEESATIPIMPVGTRRENKPYKSKYRESVDIAKSNGIKYNTFLNRVTVLGWSEYDAATIPTGGKRNGS